MVKRINACDEHGNLLLKLVQYDRDVYVYINDKSVTKLCPVHFSTEGSREALVSADVVYDNGILKAKIPNTLLEKGRQITGWVYIDQDGGNRTTAIFMIDVIRKPKPNDWVETDSDDYVSIVKLKEDLIAEFNRAVEDATGSIGGLIEDYLTEHPPVLAEVDPTVPQWAKQPSKPSYTPQEVGAMPANTYIPPAYDDEALRRAILTLQTELNKKANADDIPPAYDDTALRSAISTLQTELNKKANASDIPSAYDDTALRTAISNLQTELNEKANKDELPAIPDKLPSPGKLTFTGAATAEYDGSGNVTVNIPTGNTEDSVTEQTIEGWGFTKFNGDYNSLTNKPEIPEAYDDTSVKKDISTLQTELDKKQGVIIDLSDIRSGADLGRTALQRVPDGYRTADAQDEIDNGLSQRIDAIEASKFPNAVFIGEPLIVGTTVSRFTSTDYMIFPFMVDVRNKPFSIEFAFHTGADVTRQQNILDSHFGMALAIQNGRGIMALSSNGSSWDIGLVTGSMAIAPNTNYYAKISWDGSAYTGSLSTDGETYIPDMYAASTAGLYPQTMYIGGAPDLFGTESAHPFGGGVDMDHSRLLVAGLEVWHGMDDPGLASRANISLSNLDALGKEKFKAQNLPYEDDAGKTTVGEALNGLKEGLTHKYSKPAGGIPKTDLSSEVQSMLESSGDGGESAYYTTPEAHGAAGDGVADDSTAIQAAIDSGLAVVMTGSYKVTQRLVVRDNLTIDGHNATLTMYTNTALFGTKAYTRNVTIRGLKAISVVSADGLTDTQRLNTNKFFSTSQGVSDLLIENCEMRGFLSDCVYLNASAGTHCENVIVRNCRLLDFGRQGIAVIDCFNLIVDECVVDVSNAVHDIYAIDVESNETGTGHGYVYLHHVTANVGINISKGFDRVVVRDCHVDTSVNPAFGAPSNFVGTLTVDGCDFSSTFNDAVVTTPMDSIVVTNTKISGGTNRSVAVGSGSTGIVKYFGCDISGGRIEINGGKAELNSCKVNAAISARTNVASVSITGSSISGGNVVINSNIAECNAIICNNRFDPTVTSVSIANTINAIVYNNIGSVSIAKNVNTTDLATKVAAVAPALTGVAGSGAGDVTPADVATALKAGKTVILSRMLSMTGSPDDAAPVVFSNFAGTPDYGLVLASFVFPNALSDGAGDYVVQLIGSPDTGWVDNLIPLSGGSGLPTVQKLAELTTTEEIASISIDLPKAVTYFILTVEGTGSAQASVRIQNQNNRDIAYGYNNMKTTATCIIAECMINSGVNVIARMFSGPNFVANNSNPTAFFSADYRDYVPATKLKVNINSGTFNTGIRVRVWGY